MRKSTTLTQFIQELSVLLDKGATRSIDEVNKHIEAKDVIDWLEYEFSTNDTGVDFSMFQRRHRDYLHKNLLEMWEVRAGDERRKWGLTENGLCVLISWTTEIIRSEFNKDEFIN